MMVNPAGRDVDPWQSTVPQQMPWMSSYQQATSNLQFGHQSPNSPISLPQPPAPLSPFQVAPASSLVPSSIPAINPLCTISEGITTASQFSHNITSSSSPPLVFSPVPAGLTTAPNCYNFTNSLTQLPTQCNSGDQNVQHKRRSLEMDDEQISAEEPPTKQLLSEHTLFKKFGSLHLNGNSDSLSTQTGYLDDDNDDDTNHREVDTNRENFNRYVYLLFKDKVKDTHFSRSDKTLDRLAREEREKLSKAVILWSPPNYNRFFDDEISDDEDFTYNDHRDFLRRRPNESIIITDVTEELANEQNPCIGLDSENMMAD